MDRPKRGIRLNFKVQESLSKRNKQRVHMSSAAETVENASILAESAAHDGNRLWIGNIDPKITEFHLVKLLEKFGKVKQFDFLFHKSGPLEGQPRGYCFVNFSSREEAERAIQCLNGKLALSKKLVVRWAHAQVRVSRWLEGGFERNECRCLLLDAEPRWLIFSIQKCIYDHMCGTEPTFSFQMSAACSV